MHKPKNITTEKTEEDNVNQDQKEENENQKKSKREWTKPTIHKADVFLYCMKEG